MTEKDVNILTPKFIFSSVALAMGIAVFILTLMKQLSPLSAASMIAVGLICIALSNMIIKDKN